MFGLNHRLAHAMHVALMLHAVADQFRHRQHHHVVHRAELDQVGHTRHRAVVLHDFANNPRRYHARQARQIDRRFCLPGAHQHSTFAGAQRKNVSWSRQVRGPRRRIDRNLYRVAAVIGGNPCRQTFASVNRFAKRCAVLRRVLGRHVADPQMVEPLFGHGQADQAAPVLGHKVDGLGRDAFGGQREVAFILAIFVVNDHNHPPLANLADRSLYIGKWWVSSHIFCASILLPSILAGRAITDPGSKRLRAVKLRAVNKKGSPKATLPSKCASKTAYSVDSISNPQASINGSGMYFEFLFRRAHSRSRVDRKYWSGDNLYSCTTCSNSVIVGVTGPMGSGFPQLGFPRRLAMRKVSFYQRNDDFFAKTYSV